MPYNISKKNLRKHKKTYKYSYRHRHKSKPIIRTKFSKKIKSKIRTRKMQSGGFGPEEAVPIAWAMIAAFIIAVVCIVRYFKRKFKQDDVKSNKLLIEKMFEKMLLEADTNAGSKILSPYEKETMREWSEEKVATMLANEEKAGPGAAMRVAVTAIKEEKHAETVENTAWENIKSEIEEQVNEDKYARRINSRIFLTDHSNKMRWRQQALYQAREALKTANMVKEVALYKMSNEDKDLVAKAVAAQEASWAVVWADEAAVAEAEFNDPTARAEHERPRRHWLVDEDEAEAARDAAEAEAARDAAEAARDAAEAEAAEAARVEAVRTSDMNRLANNLRRQRAAARAAEEGYKRKRERARPDEDWDEDRVTVYPADIQSIKSKPGRLIGNQLGGTPPNIEQLYHIINPLIAVINKFFFLIPELLTELIVKSAVYPITFNPHIANQFYTFIRQWRKKQKHERLTLVKNLLSDIPDIPSNENTFVTTLSNSLSKLIDNDHTPEKIAYIVTSKIDVNFPKSEAKAKWINPLNSLKDIPKKSKLFKYFTEQFKYFGKKLRSDSSVPIILNPNTTESQLSVVEVKTKPITKDDVDNGVALATLTEEIIQAASDTSNDTTSDFGDFGEFSEFNEDEDEDFSKIDSVTKTKKPITYENNF